MGEIGHPKQVWHLRVELSVYSPVSPQRFRGYFSTTNGAITEDILLQYLNNHIADPTGASR